MYDFNLTPLFVIWGIICGLVGWAVIEGVWWLVTHISIALV